MTGPLENNELCFPQISVFPSGSKTHCSPRDQSLSVNFCAFRFVFLYKSVRFYVAVRLSTE